MPSLPRGLVAAFESLVRFAGHRARLAH
jgi:hypothetical protein